MGKSTRKKQAKLDEREHKITSQLTAHRESGKHARGVVTAFTPGIITKVLQTLEPHYIRPIEDWIYKGKSKKIDKQRLSLLRHLCGKYPVPPFLENPMIIDDNDRFSPVFAALSNDSNGSIIPWYVAVAQGKSLYKTCTREFLTKRETHLLLQAPSKFKIKAAIWWAKTMALSNDVGIAHRISSSNFITRSTHKNEFWIDVHRFFTTNPVPINEMDQLLDYIVAARRESISWTIKKRSLEAVRRKSEEWHRAQYKMKHIGGGSWTGMADIPTWSHKTGKFDNDPKKNTKVTWKIEEILTGNKLAQEGQKMRHCVAAYKSACMTGRTAIFSMTTDTVLKSNYRNLTIEVETSSRRLIQAKGYANRLPTPTEKTILNKWATENDVRSYSRW